MLKKILKHTLRTLLVILLVLLLVPALLYVPAVQDLARRRAVAYASRTLGMEVSVDSPRIDLETLFLDVVRDSDDSEGGGRVRASSLAPFLGGGTADRDEGIG